MLTLADGHAVLEGVASLKPSGSGLTMDRPAENQNSRLRPCGASTMADIAGRYGCESLGAELDIVGGGGVFYGGFSGRLGAGRMELLEPIGADIWALPCPRALDHTPPGDWTLAFRRDDGGEAVEVEVGCWLARGLTYRRIGSR